MIIPDANILIYATNRDSAHHRSALEWWQAMLSDEEPVGVSWLVLLAFVRVSTHPRILQRPLSPGQATGLVDEWIAQPPVRIIEATDRHWDILKALLRPLGTAGNLTSDAHLAALAIGHGARLCSTDNDFSRFVGLSWENPLAPR